MIVLGLHGGTHLGEHDPGAAIVRNGAVVAACEEERFLRVKSPIGTMPVLSIAACLRAARLSIRDVDFVAHTGATHPEKPRRIREYLEHYFRHAPPVRMVHHHAAHLASAFFASGFERAMCLTCDAWGDHVSTALALGTPDGVRVIETHPRENSLGLFYAAVTSYLGFTAGEDEYKVMGLAAYGRPGVDLSTFARSTPDGHDVDVTFLADDYPDRTATEPLYSPRLVELLGPSRSPEEPITQRHRDIAFGAQETLERCLLGLVRRLHVQTGLHDLCMAGGVALNCSANATLARCAEVDRLFVQPAASDRGLALGCALQVAFEEHEPVRPLPDVFLGPTYSDEEIRSALDLGGWDYREVSDPAAEAAQMLAAGEIVGWFQGRSELGPRALGNRSILADPRPAGMKDAVNARIKFREEFRPLAPAVLEERAAELFEVGSPSPFMTVAYRVRPEWAGRIPSVVHVNGTARVQTVDRGRAPLFHRLIEAFAARTGVPAVLNTSFNLRGQPIVETPRDALATFAACGLSGVFLGRFLVLKPRRPASA